MKKLIFLFTFLFFAGIVVLNAQQANENKKEKKTEQKDEKKESKSGQKKVKKVPADKRSREKRKK